MNNFKTRQAQVAERSVFLNRVLFSSLAILLLGGLIISRLIYLMVIESDELSLRSVNNTLRTQSIPAPRGLIYDRNIEVNVRYTQISNRHPRRSNRKTRVTYQIILAF